MKRKDPFRIKFCIMCGKRIPPTSDRQKLCSERCAKKRKVLHRRGLPAPYENCTEPPMQTYTLGEVNAEARAHGMSYGQYMLKRSRGEL